MKWVICIECGYKLGWLERYEPSDLWCCSGWLVAPKVVELPCGVRGD